VSIMSEREYIVIELPRGPGYRIRALFRRLAMVVYTPFELMSELAHEPDLMGALISLLLCIIAVTSTSTLFSSRVRIIYVNATTNKVIGVIGGGISKGRVLSSFVMTSLTTLVGWLMVTIIIYLTSSFLKGISTLRSVASAVGYASFIRVLVEIIRIMNIAVATRDTMVTVKINIGKNTSMKYITSLISSAISSQTGWPYAILNNFLSYLLQVWMLALFIIIPYSTCGLSLKKSILVGAVAFVIALFIRWI